MVEGNLTEIVPEFLDIHIHERTRELVVITISTVDSKTLLKVMTSTKVQDYINLLKSRPSFSNSMSINSDAPVPSKLFAKEPHIKDISAIDWPAAT